MIEIKHEDAIVNTFILFVQTAQAVLKSADAFLYRKANLSVIKLIVLQALEINKGVMTPSEIAEWTQTERHNITALVQRMKRDGLVTSERNSKDKRIVHIILTDRGREVLEQTMPAAREIKDLIMSSITEEEAELMANKLRVLRQNAFNALGQMSFHIKKWPE